MSSLTIRQQIIDCLKTSDCDIRELSQALRQSEKELYDHLQHIGRSLQVGPEKLHIEPPTCLHCGFIFTGRTQPKPPGRCPQCRRTHISRPRYRISAPQSQG